MTVVSVLPAFAAHSNGVNARSSFSSILAPKSINILTIGAPLSAAAHKKLGFGASCGACTEHPACISSLAQPHRLLAIASHNGGEVAGVSNGAFNSTNALATAKCPCPTAALNALNPAVLVGSVFAPESNKV